MVRTAMSSPEETDMSATSNRNLWLMAILWLAVVGVALAVRPPLPVDETRYLAVAWDMWLEGNYLVPHLHGEPYSHKPPLLFWLMTAGWHVFGVNDWWPRLVAPLFGLGCLVVTFRLARVLWPDKAEAAGLVPVLLFGAIFWTVFGTLTMFDMLLAFFAVLAVLGLVDAAHRGGCRGFILAGVAIGFGILAKGPAILLHVLPIALAAPWWASNLRTARWYMGLGFAVTFGVAIGLGWAIPAGMAGGEAYRDAIFWGQSANRMVNSFAHSRPFWWYAMVLPALVLPWLVWPPLWRAARRFGDLRGDGGIRLCLVWFATAFVVFSLISGKQLHYLLPEFPALALIVARLLAEMDEADAMPAAIDRWLPSGLAILIGGLLMLAPYLPLSARAVSQLGEATPAWGGLIVIAGVLVLLSRDAVQASQAIRLATISAFIVMAIYLAAAPVLSKRYDLRAMAGHLAALEDDGKAIAYFGKYHGQFHFLGRLKRPMTMIGLLGDDEARFLSTHPDGVVIAKYDNLPTKAVPLFTYPYRNYTYAVWPAAALITYPRLGNRR